jgi:hypothetical protein
VRTREHLSELEAKGARLVEPSLETLATLDALQSLLGDAQSGDLARGGDAVDSSTVLAWLEAGLNIGADELESVQRFWCALTGTGVASADATATTAKARLRQVRGEQRPTPQVTPADPERLEAELAAYQSARMPLEAAVAVSASMGGLDEGASPAITSGSESLTPRPSEGAPETSGRRPFWSLFARRRQDKAQRSDVAAANRLASLLRG